MQDFISVIIICYNEEKYLAKTLEALREQNYPNTNYEIIFIDNGSTDNSVNIAEKYLCKCFIKPELSLGAMRNFGASNAQGNILAFLDADCVVNRRWLYNINEIYNSSPNTINGGSCLASESSSWIAKSWFYKNHITREKVNSLGAANFFLSKEIFFEFGGFDQTLTTGEDSELFSRIANKYAIMIDSKLDVAHLGVPEDLITFFRREIWHGLGAFGSFKINKFDKPLIATFIFGFGIFLSIIGIFIDSLLMLSGFLISNIILVLTLIHRRERIINFSHAIKLYLLYAFYFLARNISLIILLFKMKHRYYKTNS